MVGVCMNTKFLIVLLIFLFLGISAVSANDLNGTETVEMDINQISDLNNFNTILTEVNSNGDVKETPVISINSTEVYTGSSLGISIKDSKGSSISNQKLSVNINNENYNLNTNDNGVAVLNLNLKPDFYTLKVLFSGDDNFNAVNGTFNVTVLKLACSITPVSTSVYQYKYFYIYLKDNFENPIKGASVSFNINKNTYDSNTDDAGKARIKISLTADARYSMKIYYSGNDYYESVSKNILLTVPAVTSIEIGNNKLITNGFLRVYLKSSTLSAISQKTVIIKIGTKTYKKTTNDEGVIVFKPNLNADNYKITVIFEGNSQIDGCNNSKDVKCIVGDVKNPLKEKIPLVNGTPDIDVMPAKYIMADGDMKYTLLKSQYQETIKRDSYYLYLYNKLSKYVYFKTKYGSDKLHIIVREKWNVIERAINTKIVLKNKFNYWPDSITVSLKGKSYTYPQVRDVQNTGYTCGPTSCSMCSQVLKNYVNEKQLGKLAGSNSVSGSTTKGLKKALEKNNFKCSYYYKSSFTAAINQLKKGGCALIFHTWNHYVAILDISKDGKKVLVGNPSGDYDHGSHSIPTNWLTVSYMKKMFNNYDTSGLIVKLKYSIKSSTKTQLKNTYSSFGAGWVAKNTSERISQIN